jgi:hypothetical protein
MLAELARAYGLLESDDDLADLEPGEPFGRLLLHRYILDARPPRTGLQEPKDALHSLSWTLQGRLEGAVRAVRGPATDAVSLGALADRVAKEDALHTAVDDCPPPDLIVHLRNSCSVRKPQLPHQRRSWPARFRWRSIVRDGSRSTTETSVPGQEQHHEGDPLEPRPASI